MQKTKLLLLLLPILPKTFLMVTLLFPSIFPLLLRDLESIFRLEQIKRFVFFGCGEYGEKRSRPHYHLLIFGIDKENLDCIQKSWKLGIIDIQQPRCYGNVESYVAGYVSKKQPKIHYGKDRVPPFHRQSLGIGWNFVKERFPCFSPICIMNNKTRYIGRYLRNKLAEKFNVLEQVKKEGINKMIESLKESLRDFMLEFDWFEDEFFYSPVKALRKAFPLFYQGDLELLLSRQKIFLRRDL